MRFFVCHIAQAGQLAEEAGREYDLVASARGLPFRWHRRAEVSVMVAQDEADKRIRFVHSHRYVGVGDVRLDNRAELEHLTGSDDKVSDLDLVARLVIENGVTYANTLLGDFCFVLFDLTRRTIVAGRDAFGVRHLYYAAGLDAITFSSRGEIISRPDRYDPQFFSELVAYCAPSAGHCAYAGVTALPPATLFVINDGKGRWQQYWSPESAAAKQLSHSGEKDAVPRCRELLTEAVICRLSDDAPVWAQLSGGLDSSSVVSLAQYLQQAGAIRSAVSGTITYADSHGTGADERQYSRVVTELYGLPNEVILDAPLWDEMCIETIPDQPSAMLPLARREQETIRILRRAGARILLTGQGGDDLFAGNMFFFADWLVSGRASEAIHTMITTAAKGRVSFWELAYKNALLPLLPAFVQRALVRGEGRVPPWVCSRVSRQFDLPRRSALACVYTGRLGHKYGDGVTSVVRGMSSKLGGQLVEEELDVRHPFLYRPLVEFALTLPPDLVVKPYARKWILRESMRGILPEKVRTRVGKGVLLGLLTWSATHQEKLLRAMMRESVLADLGVIDVAKLRAAASKARHERERAQLIASDLQYTLALEAWLQLRSGRRPRGSSGSVEASDGSDHL